MSIASNSADYLRKREAHERALAQQATDVEVQEIYLQLAEWYRTLAENAEQTQKPTNR